jgi:nitroreductase
MIAIMMARASTRAYTDVVPSPETIDTIVRAGQQAPFAMQMCSIILTRGADLPWKAPLGFLICVDAYRIERIVELRGWETRTCDLGLFIFAVQDAAYMAQNMVIAAEALGLGSCYIGSPPFMAARLAEKHRLPPKVFPLVQLVMGYPAERPPARPRYPLWFACFEDVYPRLSEAEIREAMRVMDEGYLAQDYYKRDQLKLPVPKGRKDPYTFADYSWTEHMARKLQWNPLPDELLENLRRCGFDLTGAARKTGDGQAPE